MNKSQLRRIYLAKQKLLSPQNRTEVSRQISEKFFQNFDFAAVKVLHCFIPIEKFNEIETAFIFQKLWREFPGITAVVPRVDIKTGEMRNLRFTPETELVSNAWGILEPEHDEFVETVSIDMVLAPLLCFDEAGHRVGYGKGFYDRLLNNCRSDCVKIGLSYFPPVAEIEDANELDARLDYCVTPESVFGVGKE